MNVYYNCPAPLYTGILSACEGMIDALCGVKRVCVDDEEADTRVDIGDRGIEQIEGRVFEKHCYELGGTKWRGGPFMGLQDMVWNILGDCVWCLASVPLTPHAVTGCSRDIVVTLFVRILRAFIIGL
jgi:hypothetical protein